MADMILLSKMKETEIGYSVKLENFLKLDKKQKIEFRNEFCYQSNLIEGIRTPIDRLDTIDINEVYAIPPELGDHFSAFDYMLENSKKVLNEQDIKQMHFLLMKNLLSNPEKYAGHYRQCKIWIGEKGGPYSSSVPSLMKDLSSDIQNVDLQNAWPEDILSIHHKFETIHPFIDGNGRTGRLILNWLSLKYLGEFNVVTLNKRQNYYKMISDFKEEFMKKNPKVKFYNDRTINTELILLESDSF